VGCSGGLARASSFSVSIIIVLWGGDDSAMLRDIHMKGGCIESSS
jgi:hypothetical protein